MSLALISFVYSRDQFYDFQGQRSINNREGAIKSLKWFDKYLASLGETESSVMPKLLELKGKDEFYLFLNGFVQFMVKELHPHSVQTYLSFVKSYFRKHGFKIYNEDVKQFIDMPRTTKESRAPLSKKEIRILLNSASPYLKMVILWLESSGMRISEFLQLKKEDVKLDLDPVEIHIRAETTKTRTDRVTFISQQAKESMTKDLFKPYTSKIDLLNLEQQFNNLRNSCGLNEKYRTSNIHHITLHTFRSYFRTIVGMYNKDFAEDILGHEGYLNQYIRLPMEKKQEFYKVVEPQLKI